ncbi:hypothetical protein [Bremerella cremea]|uniref:hypothetical protein n=1 Tax=Bremerella cremea TaxID=1031537 RepID=UPI0031EE91C4
MPTFTAFLIRFSPLAVVLSAANKEAGDAIERPHAAAAEQLARNKRREDFMAGASDGGTRMEKGLIRNYRTNPSDSISNEDQEN